MHHFPVTGIAIGLAALAASALPVVAATETVVYSFNNPNGNPVASLRFIGGSLYGSGAGAPLMHTDGEIFKLTQKGDSWKEKTLHIFDDTDGNSPVATVIRGKNGVLYGTTSGGDKYNGGNVFALTRSGNKWVDQTIWAFGGTGDGAQPNCDLVVDKSGNLYGTTFDGGAQGVGIVFELSQVNGRWVETVLHSFANNAGDGWEPYAGLLMAGPETFYGTTFWGGDAGGNGAVFKLFKSGGAWKEEVIFSFDGADGYEPMGTLIMDKEGALYGTTKAGGVSKDWSDVGVAFKLSPSGNTWKETILHTFGSFDTDGWNPIAGLAWGPSGTLYGTTTEGGCPGHPGVGTVFELTPPSISGVWKEAILHCFTGDNGDGSYPQGGIVLGKDGALYGTTSVGGTYNYGEVWKITP